MRYSSWEYALTMMLLGISAVIYALTLPGCRTSVPAIDAKFWAGDSANHGITRAQDNKTIECDEPEIDEYVCLTYDDLRKIYNTLLQCKDWGNVQLMSSNRAKKFYRKNRNVLDNILYEDTSKVESIHR